MTPSSFIATLAPLAQALQRATGIPASFTIAQSALESGWLNSGLAAKYNNLFGEKGTPPWTGKTVTLMTGEIVDGKRVVLPQPFRIYDNLQDCLNGHGEFLTNGGTKKGRYAAAFKAKTVEDFAAAVAKGGYSTLGYPAYSDAIIKEINLHGLRQYDVVIEPEVDAPEGTA